VIGPCVKTTALNKFWHKGWLAAVLCMVLALPVGLRGEELPIGPGRDMAVAQQYAGRNIDAVIVRGNTQVQTPVILNLIRTHEGDKFDPSTVVEDYQRIYDRTKLLANVEARIQPTETGVIVIFVVTEQRQIKDVVIKGNRRLDDDDLRPVLELHKGQAIDAFKINLAAESMEKLYREKNYTYAHVQPVIGIDGTVTFNVVEGPQVDITMIDFIGNNTFSTWRLKDEVKSKYKIFLIRPGTYEPQTVDDDVAAVAHFYQDKGFFDVRVGRKITMNDDWGQMELTFVIDEGPRYYIDRVIFNYIGAATVPEGVIRPNLNLVEGTAYDKDVLERDKRAIVKAYSKAGGYVYDQQPGQVPNPLYLNIRTKQVYKKDPGHIDLVYSISEGRQFRLGRILIKGNTKTKDNVILREMRMRPGQMYDSNEVTDALDRLRGLPYFDKTSIRMTPIGDDPEVRDLLVEVDEARTSQISAGVGVNSNRGMGANLSYEQKNADITNVPHSLGEFFSDKAFTGAGQDLYGSFNPGTQATTAVLQFSEPWIFDQPYGFTGRVELNDQIRENYDDDRAGGSVTFSKRFNYQDSVGVTLSGYDVNITHLNDPTDRALEIQEGQGHHTLSGVGVAAQHDTTNHGPLTYRGTDTVIGFTQYGAMGGTVTYDRVSFSFSDYETLTEDLLDRRTVLESRINVGDDLTNAPFYERFYGGGFGSVRGFQYRGITPRDFVSGDRLGGNFAATGTEQVSFPLAEDVLRGVLFADYGDVEPSAEIGTIRTSVGFGVRITIPFLGQIPIALDFGFPITKAKQDDTQILSFSFGVSR